MNDKNSDYRSKYILHKGDTIQTGNTICTISDFVSYGGSAVIYSAISSESSIDNPIKHIIKEIFPNEDLFERRSGIIRPRDLENATELKWFRDHIAEEHELGGLCYNGTNLAVPIRHVIHPDKITIDGKEYTEDIQDGVFAVLDNIAGKAISFSQMLEHIRQPKNAEFPLQNGGCPTLHTTARLIEEVLLTLQSVHNQNVLFGDIHMDNIWFGDSRLDLGNIRTAIFMDFGCSRKLLDGKKTAPIIDQRIFSSKGYRPPELSSVWLSQHDGRLSIQADIFSVGCLMLRCLFPEEYWDHFGESPCIGPRTVQRDDAKRLGIDDSLRRKVNAILAKAMHPDPEKRYPSADAMREDIHKLVLDTAPPTYLLPKAPGSSESFVEGSRDTEIDRIMYDLEINKPVFLWGCGGIGKSEIAIKVAKEFDTRSTKGAYFIHYTIPFDKTQEAMEETVLRMPLSGFVYEPESGMSPEEQRKAEYKKRIRILIDQYAGALLVIDNFDWPGKTLDDLRSEQSYQEITSIGLNLLFTTRNEVPGTPEVKELSGEDLLKLMRRWYTDPRITDQQLLDLIEAVGGHTLTVDIIAKTLSRSRRKITPEMMLECFKSSKLSEVNYPKVTLDTVKKGQEFDSVQHREPKTAQIYEHLKALFDLSDLDEQMKTILCCATLLPAGGMDCQLFESCLEEGQEDAFDHLLDCGWLKNSDDNVLAIHTIIRAVCKDELEPNLEIITLFLNNLSAHLEREDVSDEELLQITEVIMSLDFSENTEGYVKKAANVLNAFSMKLIRCGRHEDALPYMAKAHCLVEKLAVGYMELAADMDVKTDAWWAVSGCLTFAMYIRESALRFYQREENGLALIYWKKALAMQKKAFLYCNHQFDKKLYANLSNNSAIGVENGILLTRDILIFREKHFPDDLECIFETYHELAEYYRESGDFENTGDCQREMLKILKERNADNLENEVYLDTVIEILEDMHTAAQTCKNPKRRRKMYNQLLTLESRFKQKDNRIYAFYCSMIAEIYIDLEEYDKGLPYLFQAVDFYEEEPDQTLELVSLYLQIGIVSAKHTDIDGLFYYLDKIIEILEKKFDPRSESLRHFYAMALILYAEKGEKEKARHYAKKFKNENECWDIVRTLINID